MDTSNPVPINKEMKSCSYYDTIFAGNCPNGREGDREGGGGGGEKRESVCCLTNQTSDWVSPVPQSSHCSPGQSLVGGISDEATQHGELHGQCPCSGRAGLCRAVHRYSSTQVDLQREVEREREREREMEGGREGGKEGGREREECVF